MIYGKCVRLSGKKMNGRTAKLSGWMQHQKYSWLKGGWKLVEHLGWNRGMIWKKRGSARKWKRRNVREACKWNIFNWEECNVQKNDSYLEAFPKVKEEITTVSIAKSWISLGVLMKVVQRMTWEDINKSIRETSN